MNCPKCKVNKLKVENISVEIDPAKPYELHVILECPKCKPPFAEAFIPEADFIIPPGLRLAVGPTRNRPKTKRENT